MLSYRHAFHAGNFADVLKHSVLIYVLDYMARKDKGYSYIDTHSGAGMYALQDDYAQKTGEYKDGIGKLYQSSDLPEILNEYISLISSLNNNKSLEIYPGSPGIAKELLRRQDFAHLFELHKSDFELLEELCQRWKKSRVYKSDGYNGLLEQLPPPTRRGVVLMDPPFELKEDYVKSVKTIIQAYRKFSTGTYLLWYPVVKRSYIEAMEEQFVSSNVRNVIQLEYCQKQDSDEYGMTGTGLFIVNPPWQLLGESDNLLTTMKEKLGNKHSSYTARQLIDE
ncbi:ribosomal RNA large subunit methyltransferase J [Thalassotalea loyana]|uniref:Ribosomal RNA large subunit methyltransferase J n=1 Tax=Thalassotalea loyana TaxID=280483 RepID=A0ABQ6HEL7_9GAMM|nr:23S rRNA (adenine(2030)-N(6))-methyltransferase RlmJ [Thalassotalea loyana]GLX86561.1 ribosomal RNA large subunit methyltransferase J [Thalassotalea loyana]